MIRGGLLTPPFARFLIILITLAALPTCGVELKETFEGTEVFKGIALSGERVAGGELTLTLTVSQGYAVPVRIACLYENRSTRPPGWQKLAFEERATLIGETVLPAVVGSKPGDGGERQTFSFPFVVPEAGDYQVVCLTPAAPDNALRIEFRVAAAD